LTIRVKCFGEFHSEVDILGSSLPRIVEAMGLCLHKAVIVVRVLSLFEKHFRFQIVVLQ